jgi:hypothetical protein
MNNKQKYNIIQGLTKRLVKLLEQEDEWFHKAHPYIAAGQPYTKTMLSPEDQVVSDRITQERIKVAKALHDHLTKWNPPLPDKQLSLDNQTD